MNVEAQGVEVEPLSLRLAAAWRGLFDACGCTCFCRYWHFEGSKNEWLARSAEGGEASAEEQLALVRDGAPQARGLVAMQGDVALGWMKLVPRGLVPKLRKQGAYRALGLGDDASVHSVGCLLVRRDARRKGVARALVAAAPRWARSWGARAIEAYPHRVTHALHDEEAWMGPESLFRDAGWDPVHDVAPYPVYRKTLLSSELGRGDAGG